MPKAMTRSQAAAWVRQQCSSGAARRIREAANVSQAEVADDVGVSSATISRWELGVRTPRGLPALRYGIVLRQLLTSCQEANDVA